jgi:uncharacterized membrane protein YhhN
MTVTSTERPSSSLFWNTVKFGLILYIGVMVYMLLFNRAFPYTVFALAASTGVIVLGLLGASLRNRFDWFIMLALIACWFGDYMGPHNFYAGAAAFLVAHLFLIAAYISKGIVWRKCFIMVGPLFVLFLTILFWIFPRVPREGVPLVLSYMLVISAMVFFAGGASSGPTGRRLLIGSIIFYVSDIFVARGKFIEHDMLSRLGSHPLYYVACVIFALSLWSYNKTPGAATPTRPSVS